MWKPDPIFDAGSAARRAKIVEALAQLDRVLERAVKELQGSEDGDPVSVFYRGLQIREEDAERLLNAQPCSPRFRSDGGAARLGEDIPCLAWLAGAFALTEFDVSVLLLALAPEIDLRYERLYAYLNDDVTRKRPTVDLALHLFSESAATRLELRSRFAADAPLVCNRLIHLIADPAQTQPPLLAHYIRLDEQVVALALGEESLDARLAGFCRFVTGSEQEPARWEAESHRALAALAAQSRAARRPLRLYFKGAAGGRKLRSALALARGAGARLLAVDLAQAAESGAALQDSFRLALREAWLKNAVLYLDGADALRREERAPAWRALLEALAAHTGILVLSGTLPWAPVAGGPAGVVTAPFDVLGPQQAREVWSAHLSSEGVALPDAGIDLLADRFRLTEEQIADAAECAIGEAAWRQAAITLDGICAAARSECGHELTKLARKILPKYGWEDIVLPDDQIGQLREICEQARYRNVVFGKWGFERKLSLGRGLNVLFSGPPGTGKTMAAEVLATELRLDLYKIDLAQVVSKYIGETEKNLDRIFTLAENSNAILFFDEADALFGKRSEVKDSHDRYANIEIGYLLQKMEEYEGIAVLATNVKHHIDEAFVRRMQAIIEFPFPEEAERRHVWEVIFPEQTPVGPDVDFAALARAVRLAGGNIRNIARASAFYAAADGGVVGMEHLIRASRREYQKLGRTWNESEWGAALAEAV